MIFKMTTYFPQTILLLVLKQLSIATKEDSKVSFFPVFPLFFFYFLITFYYSFLFFFFACVFCALATL